MARYIDADKVQPDCISTKGRVAISQSQLASQPTADVVERSKIDKAIEEIKECSYSLSCFNEDVFDEDERVVDLDNILIILDRLIESEE